MPSPRISVFAPAPLLTVTIEDGAYGPEVHFHPGGQGFWIARLAASLGAEVELCASFGGEAGSVVRALLNQYRVGVYEIPAAAENGVYVHDRRGGERTSIVEASATPLSRHELDELYNAALVSGLESDVTVLGGPSPSDLLPVDLYRRLAGDLRASEKTVVVDLCGPVLDAALAGGVSVVKMSLDEVLADKRAETERSKDLFDAMQRLRAGTDHVVVTRGGDPAIALADGVAYTVSMPSVEPLEPMGGGDAFTAAVAVGLGRGEAIEQALRLGSAAKALNATRHGLGSGNRAAIDRLATNISLHVFDRTAQPVS